MQLIPSRNFTVVRQIANHTDTATYYVQAVIRNAYTDAIIATLNLTDKGGQRFKSDWLVPPEPSGLGSFISIVTTVYTDSGYTTKSADYGLEENTYLWATLQTTYGGGGQQGFSEKFDYRRLRDIVTEEITKIPQVEIPEQKEVPEPVMRWDEVLSKCDEMMNHMKSMPQEQKDDTEVLAKLEEISKLVNEKEVTPETDLKPILDKLNEENDTNELNHDEAKSMIDASTKKIIEAIPKEMLKAIKKVKIVTATATHFSTDGKDISTSRDKTISGQTNTSEKTPEQQPIDHVALANSLSS
jgi:hypothetical protein